MSQELKVADVMSPEVATLDKDRSVKDAVELMASRNFGAVVVSDGGVPVGIFTERDLVKRVVALDRPPAQTSLAEAMTPKLISAHPSDDFKDLARSMYLANLRHMTVLDQGKLVGIVSIRDALRVLGGF